MNFILTPISSKNWLETIKLRLKNLSHTDDIIIVFHASHIYSMTYNMN